jgi:hypothetical protein
MYIHIYEEDSVFSDEEKTIEWIGDSSSSSSSSSSTTNNNLPFLSEWVQEF